MRAIPFAGGSNKLWNLDYLLCDTQPEGSVEMVYCSIPQSKLGSKSWITEVSRPFGIPRRIWEGNKVDLRKVSCEEGSRMELVQVHTQRLALAIYQQRWTFWFCNVLDSNSEGTRFQARLGCWLPRHVVLLGDSKIAACLQIIHHGLFINAWLTHHSRQSLLSFVPM